MKAVLNYNTELGNPEKAGDMPKVGENLLCGERITRMRRRYQTGPAYISIERAKYYTEKWRATEGKGLVLPVRVAMAMKHVYENMTHYVDPDDRIAGYWTEQFLGIPVDIERGVFNSVLESELTKGSMILFRTRSLAKGLGYMVRKGVLGDFLKNQRVLKKSGTPPLNMDFKTMSERAINPYQIRAEDRSILLWELLPFWKGKAIVDQTEKALMDSGLYARDMHDFVAAIPGNTSRQVLMVSAAASIASFQGHVILDYSPTLEKGLLAMREETGKLLADTPLADSKHDFLESIVIALDGVIVFAQRLVERLETAISETEDPPRRAELEEMLAICRQVPFHPARTFREAVQSLWTVKTAVELAHPVNLHCFGRLDQILCPYYERDLEEGRINEPQARELLEELLLKIMSQNIRPESNLLSNFYHRFLGSSPVTLGGVSRDGSDCTNALTYLFLEAAHTSKAITNVSLRVHNGSPQHLLETAAAFLEQGTSSFSFFNDEVHIDAMKRRGFSEEDARDYAIMGCVEATCPGKTGSMSANALQLCKVLDITLRNGDVMTLAGRIRDEGLPTGAPGDFESFDAFVRAFIAQGKVQIKKIVEASNLRDRMFANCLPAPYISAFMEGCIEQGKDITQGGSRYNLSGISTINSIANVIDSLHVIRTLVFEQRKFTLSQLVEAMDANFSGYEDILHAIRKVSGKWGNGAQETDELAQRVMKELFEETYHYENYRGGPFVVYVISMITHTIDGRLSVASLDGRMAATPYAASCNPYNVEKAGVTAALRSVAALPFEHTMGCAVNMRFHPTAIGKSAKTREKWVSLLRTYFKIGGAQMQPTVASAEMLRAAREKPEEYRDLVVKVGGYSTYFVDLGHEIQDEIIARTEHA
ncbi:MAG TPA: pyruvate formate lyase family protein [Candidatus Hydrogenedentes bacterium]|nr:pyruvate formate lyase family protein [Candidatus Hydrogenedentota bacterium]